MLPNFVVIGAVKAGTTSLYRYLQRHPQIFMARPKELNFFALAEPQFSASRTWYESHFEGADEASAVGEVSPSYTTYPRNPGVPQRMAELIPSARLIYLIRHPIERIRSHYVNDVLKGRERRGIDEAVMQNPIYVDLSRYAFQLEQYLQHFRREQLLVLTSEELAQDRDRTLHRVFAFLGVNPDWTDPIMSVEFHRTAEKRVPRRLVGTLRQTRFYPTLVRLAPSSLRAAGRAITTRGIDTKSAFISDGVRERLENVLRDDLERLRNYVGDDFAGWGLA